MDWSHEGAGPAIQRVLLEYDVGMKIGFVLYNIDISDHIDIYTELTKNGLNTIKVPDEVLERETADDAVKLGNEFENKSEIGLQIKNKLQTSSKLKRPNTTD